MNLRIEKVDLNTFFLYIFIFYNATVIFNHFACKFYNLKTYKAIAQCKRTVFQQTVKYNIFSSLWNRDPAFVEFSPLPFQGSIFGLFSRVQNCYVQINGSIDEWIPIKFLNGRFYTRRPVIRQDECGQPFIVHLVMLSSIKTGTRLITSLDKLSFVLLLGRRTAEDYWSRSIMRNIIE